MGDSKSCNTIAKIWQFALERYNFLSLAHLPGKQNMLADRESKVFNDQTEWMLHQDIFPGAVPVMATLRDGLVCW